MSEEKKIEQTQTAESSALSEQELKNTAGGHSALPSRIGHIASGEASLSEEELKQVTGGAADNFLWFPESSGDSKPTTTTTTPPPAKK